MRLREHSRYEFLGGRLAVGSGYLYDGFPPASAVHGGQLLQGFQHIADKHEAVVNSHLGVIHHGSCTSLLQCTGSKAVSVKRFALEGKEDRALGTVAAVRCHLRVLQVELIE